MPISTVPKTARDVTLTWLDNGGSNSFAMTFENPDFSVNGGPPDVLHLKHRGKTQNPPRLRFTEDKEFGFTVSGTLRDLVDGSYATLLGIIHNTGYVGSNWTPTNGANAEVHCWTLRIDIEGTDHGDGSDHRYELPFVHPGSYQMGDGFPMTLSLTCTSYPENSLPTLT